jgi:hypothetical protein
MFFNDFKQDSKSHYKAKIFHAILISLLIFAYRGSFGTLGLIFGDLSIIIDRFNVPIDIFSNSVNLTFFFLELLLSLIVLLLSYQMIKRKEQARKFFLLYLPFLGITSIFDFYRGWINTDNELILNDYVILAIGTGFMGGLTYMYYRIYNSIWMKAFFNFESNKTI